MIIMVSTTCSTEQEATAISRACVEKNLAACAHIDKIKSIYAWQGTPQEAEEYRVFLKTTEASYQALENLIVSLHSYAEPSVMAVPVTRGRPSYLGWIEAHSKGTPPSAKEE